jgi:hypothetical protein
MSSPDSNGANNQNRTTIIVAIIGVVGVVAAAIIAAVFSSNGGDNDREEPFPNIVFLNSTGSDIYFIYAKSSNGGRWSADLLGDMELLESGSRVTIALPRVGGQCLYDIRVEFSDDEPSIKEKQNFCRHSDIEFG